MNNHETRHHASVSPSQAARVIACPGSRRMLSQKKRDNSSSYANEGTFCHEVTEVKIKMNNAELLRLPKAAGHKSWQELAALHSANKITKEQDHVTDLASEYFDEVVREIRLVYGDVKIEIEAETNMRPYGLPECNGHVDVLIKAEKAVAVIDWKFGAGVEVSAFDNTQLKLYALGSITDGMSDDTKVLIHIFQPRINTEGESWETTAGELRQWCDATLKPAVELSRTPDAPLTPGAEQCRWCVGAACPARYAKAKQDASAIFEKFANTDEPGTLQKPEQTDFASDKELAYFLEISKALESFSKAVAKLALEKALSAGGFEGYKAVEGRSIRKWSDEDSAESYLINEAKIDRKELYEMKFVSPAKVEKLSKELKKSQEFQALVIKPPGKPTLALESDKRKPYCSPEATKVFESYVR